MIPSDPDRLLKAYRTSLDTLLSERTSEGYWTGELSSSALATAIAVCALSSVQRSSQAENSYKSLISGGLTWLADHQNSDGGWGDTAKSFSNISTTMLCRAAFHIGGAEGEYLECLNRADAYIQKHCGKTPAEHAEAIRNRYGKDRTFSIPILTTAALAGLVSWTEVPPLPFELACFPQSWFRFLRLPVVSYALPALIAIGQAVYHHRPPRNPLIRIIRRCAIKSSLRVLEAIQPSSGGFLEAVPLTSFVTLSLASIGLADHSVARQGVRFLIDSVRPDGSWAIDSNLSVWVTTLSVNALAAAGALDTLEVENHHDPTTWLLKQQITERHRYTGAAPGGWGWTHLPGSVPDADDTSGAIIALCHLKAMACPGETPHFWLLESGVWLAELQNRDGGCPTFCRGWGNLPFDRSGSDLTAHALRALVRARDTVENAPWLFDAFIPDRKTFTVPGFLRVMKRSMRRGLKFLEASQRPDGSWVPLWFGNQYATDEENPTYGTARVLAAYRDLDMMNTNCARRGIAWLLAAQDSDGGWGGAAGVPSSIEETALAVEVLLDAGHESESAVNKGVAWLVSQVEAGQLHNPTPIGFYFAKLWYFEKLYPMIFTVAALGRTCRKLMNDLASTERELSP
jgi:squalene-hopene/tetraprenyl-beta-curcumene cyclase